MAVNQCASGFPGPRQGVGGDVDLPSSVNAGYPAGGSWTYRDVGEGSPGTRELIPVARCARRSARLGSTALSTTRDRYHLGGSGYSGDGNPSGTA